MEKNIKKLVMSGVFLALCMVPLLIGHIPEIGSALSPMHIPVLICGFACGWQWGLAVGFIAPPLRYAIFGMPPILPTGIAMSFELAAYGAACGILYKLLPKKIPYIYLTLISSMLLGRIVWGIARVVLTFAPDAKNFTWAMFMSGAFINAVPGIILHIVLVPLVVIALDRARLMLNE
jgi:riboflavin transporter FmnP